MAMDLSGKNLADLIVEAQEKLGLYDTPSGNKVQKATAIAKAKVNWTDISKTILTYLKDNMETESTLVSGFSQAIGGGTPVPQDGGVALQTTQLAAIGSDPNTDKSTGTVK